MPVKTKRDEHKWQKAKDIAAESGHKDDYAYIMGIYKKMKPDYKFKTAWYQAPKKGDRIQITRDCPAVKKPTKDLETLRRGTTYSILDIRGNVAVVVGPGGTFEIDLQFDDNKFKVLHSGTFAHYAKTEAPVFVKTPRDKALWAKADELAKKQGHEGDYAYTVAIFKRMKPDYMKGKPQQGSLFPKSARFSPNGGRLLDSVVRVASRWAALNGPFNAMTDAELNKWIEVWESDAPEAFWMDGELRMSRLDALRYYRNQWRSWPPEKQRAHLEGLKRIH